MFAVLLCGVCVLLFDVLMLALLLVLMCAVLCVFAFVLFRDVLFVYGVTGYVRFVLWCLLWFVVCYCVCVYA